MRRKLLVGAVIAVVATGGTVTGCGSTSGSVTDVKTQVATASETVQDDAASSTEPEDLPSTDDSSSAAGTTLLQFGQTYTDPNGNWKVILSTPKKFKPSEYSYIDGGAKKGQVYAKVTIALTNTSDGKALDLVGFSTSAQVGEQDAGLVADSDNLRDQPSTKLLPGRTATWDLGYAGGPGQTLTVQFSDLGDFSNDGAIYDGKMPS